MAPVHLDDAAAGLLEPVRATLDSGLAALGGAPELTVCVGECAGTHAVSRGRVVLSRGLLSGIHHDAEPTGPLQPLDRWRRALGAVLEGAALTQLLGDHKGPAHAWWWVGTAVHLADRAVPDLGIAGPELACALQTGDLGAHPRAGAAVARWWAAHGRDPATEARRVGRGELPTVEQWLEAGAWLFGPQGPRAELPVDVGRVAEVDIPVSVGPWAWCRLAVPAHPRGGYVRAQGSGGGVREPWAAGGAELHTVAGATTQTCSLEPEPGGPIGVWEVESAEAFGQVFGARGVSYTFRPDGRFEVTMADAFVGPLSALPMADKVGTSGVCGGKWRVDGPERIRLAEVDPSALTMHGRQERFMVPAQGLGMAEWLRSLDEHPWTWALAGSGLVLRGRMMGGAVEVRLRAPGATL